VIIAAPPGQPFGGAIDHGAASAVDRGSVSTATPSSGEPQVGSISLVAATPLAPWRFVDQVHCGFCGRTTINWK
jgi:hypothetical protein